MAALSSIIDDLTDLVADLGDQFGEKRTRELAATHTPETATRLEVETTNGAIRVRPTDGDDLTVDAVAKTRRESDDLDAVDIVIEETDDTVTLGVDIPEENRGTSVELDVGVPDSLDVARVATKNGKIDVANVHGDTVLDTKNGKITVADIDGVVDVYAKNGAIDIRDTPVRAVSSKNGKLDLDLDAVPDDLTVEAKNGKITIAVPADADADFALSAKTGKAEVEGLTCLVEEESRTAVTGELGAGGPRIDAQTKNGTVTLRAR